MRLKREEEDRSREAFGMLKCPFVVVFEGEGLWEGSLWKLFEGFKQVVDKKRFARLPPPPPTHPVVFSL